VASSFLSSIVGEFKRYKALGDAALVQLEDSELAVGDPKSRNSAAILVWHIGGNLRSRFTDFLTSDGEKPWRHRDEEFTARSVTRGELLDKWNGGWDARFGALEKLTDGESWKNLSIPLGQSETYLKNPGLQDPARVREVRRVHLSHLSHCYRA